MILTLRTLSYRNQPVTTLIPVSFTPHGGTLGRGSDNLLVLDDPTKYISRIHAKVSCREGSWFYEDLGSNPSVINDRPVGKGRETPLAEGDRIVIGDYLLEAQLQTETAAAPLIPPAPLNNPDLPLFEPPTVVAPEPLPLFEATQVAVSPVSSGRLPDELAGARLLDVSTQPGMADPLGLNLFAGPSAATLAGLGSHDLNPQPQLRATQSDHVSPERAAFSPPPDVAKSSGMIPKDYDPLADLVPSSRPAVDIETRTVAAAPPAPQPAPVAPQVDGDGQVMQALLRGLGLPDLKLSGTNVQVAENIGAMLREATAGTMDVLMARALTKKESRMDMTMMAVRSNNPLKFFPNVDSALTQLLGNSMAGYMPPVQAMASAFDDLRAHELSVIAGMRAALSALLERCDPAQIEQKMPPASLIDKMNGGTGRQARMWQQMLEVYAEVAKDVQEAQGLFGDRFSSAYEEQVERLRKSSK